ncbi:low molecular weight phosphatase family protein [Mycolicibacterium hippocampi]|uniref:arsenate reductase/protein-tyrosine-phosphatase family protein n=1 Tax=Mycolicibacterium hippocampi TaxID=659824 RepID=UPI0027E28C9B|nr:low molecular weight phosphatase family protein [Mycolicibacterium hippocampi]
MLFVCTGNICRSPTAERLAAAHGADHGASDFGVSSAGTRAVVGHPIHSDAALVLESLGGDVSDFSARQLTPKILAGADLVLTMTRAHRDAVLERAPQKLHKTYTLCEAARLASECGAKTIADLPALRSLLPADKSLDILDPIGRDKEVFSMVGSRIADLLPPVLELAWRSSAPAGG